MSEKWYDYDFAAIRLVPRVHREEFQNVGIILYAPSSKFLAGRFIENVAALHERLSGGRSSESQADAELLARYLRSFEAIIRGDASAGPIAALSQSQRFHWLTAPRSDIFQPTAIHHGRCRNLEGCVDELFARLVL